MKNGTYELSCGEPGHDYTDHLVTYETADIADDGETVRADYHEAVTLDVALPEGEKGTPLTGPSWTQVERRTGPLTPLVRVKRPE